MPFKPWLDIMDNVLIDKLGVGVGKFADTDYIAMYKVGINPYVAVINIIVANSDLRMGIK